MPDTKDYYGALEVSPDSQPDDIKAAYRRLAKKFHPDVCKEHGVEEKFRAISEAYEVLMDARLRAQYDRSRGLGAADSGAGSGAGTAGQDAFGRDGFRWSRFTRYDDIRDIYEKSTIDQFMRKEKVASRGADIRVDIEVPLEEIARGATKVVDVPHTVPCPQCKGTGAREGRFIVCGYCGGEGQLKSVRNYGGTQVIELLACANCEGSGKVIADRCGACGGKGTAQKFRSTSVRIRAGSEDGTRILVAGMGEDGAGGAPDGDLYVVARIKPHPKFKEIGRDIYSELPVSFVDAALGAEATVETLWGQAKLRIPAGTQPGEQFRLREMGLPSPAFGLKGDHIVSVRVATVPKNITGRQRRLLQEFAALDGSAAGQENGESHSEGSGSPDRKKKRRWPFGA